MASAYYVPSGRVDPHFYFRVSLTVLFLLAGAYAYAWCGVHGSGFVRFLAGIVFSFTVIIAVDRIAVKGKVRNPRLMLATALAVSVLIWYAGWVFWSGMRTGVPVVAMRWDPASVIDVIRSPAMRNEVREIYAALFLEFGCFVALSTHIATGTARMPFSEAANAWPEKLALERRFDTIATAARQRLVAALEAAPDTLFSHLQDFPVDPKRYTLLELHMMPEGGEGFLTIIAVHEKQKDGKPDVEKTKILEHLRLPAHVAEIVRDQCAADISQPHAAAPTPPAAAAAPGKSALPDDDASDVDSQLEPALAAMHEERFDDAVALAAPVTASGAAQARADANRICALSCSRLGRWPEAADYWQALFEIEGSAHNALQVSTSMVMAGYPGDGAEWFDKTIALNRASETVAPILAYTSFISALKNSGQLRAAMPYLEWVKALYEATRTTDATALTLRGMPFFASFLEQSAPVVSACMDQSQAHAWYASMLPHLDSAGRQTLNAWLTDTRTT